MHSREHQVWPAFSVPKSTYFMSLLLDFEDTNSYVLFCASFPVNIALVDIDHHLKLQVT